MAQVEKSVLVAHPPERMFELVDRIEDYPLFLPWCGGTTLKSRDAHSTVATIHIAIAYSNEHIEIYLAKGLRHEGAKLDDEEFLEIFTLPLATALAWVREGKITDSKTVSGLFWAEKVLSGEWSALP